MSCASQVRFPPPLSPAGSSGLPKTTPPAHSWNQVRAVTLESPLHVVTRRAVTSLELGSCVSSRTRRNQVSVTLHTQTPPPAVTGQGVTGPVPGPCVSPHCPIAGTSVARLLPLAQSLGAWLALPSPSRWLLWTIRLGYAIQFTRHPHKFRGIRFTSVKAPVLRAEIAVLLAKYAIEPVPLADMRSGFYSPYFIVPKKSGGLRPILDLRVLNRVLHKLLSKMLMQERIFECICPQDWFVAIDLKRQAIPAIHVRGSDICPSGCPCRLASSPKSRERGVRILNYLDDWLILAQSRDQLCAHRDLVLRHLSQLGLRAN